VIGVTISTFETLPEQETPLGTQGVLAEVALGTPGRFAAFDDLVTLTVRAADSDERHGPFLPKGGYEDKAQCASNRSPSPLLKHYPGFFRIISIRENLSETFCRLASEAPSPPCLDHRACQGYAALGIVERCCLTGREGGPHARDRPRRSPPIHRRGVHR
jgi:hypothetical protein